MSFILGIHGKKVSDVLDNKKAAPTMEAAIERDISYHGLNAVQIFTHGPRIYTRNKYDADKIRSTCSDLSLSVHSTYPSVGVWSLTKDNITHGKTKSIYAHIEDQYKACQEIGAFGLVIHISKKPPEIIASVTKDILKPLSKKYQVKTLLEMVANKAAPDTYETPIKINRLTRLIGVGEPNSYWGWVVDTAHLWGAGVDITTSKQVTDWLKNIKYPNKIYMFHLNGSSAECGSGKDKHEIVFGPDDLIWGSVPPARSGVPPIIHFAVKHSITIICEINRGDQSDVESSLDEIKKIAGL